MAAETETLTITLPSEVVQSIRDRVAAGDYASEGDVIAARFHHDEIKPTASSAGLDDMPEDEWDVEIERRIKALDSGQETTCSLEDVMQRLDAKRSEFLRA